MELYSQTATNESGDIVNSASVSVTLSSSGAPATIFDKDGVSLANPFLTGYDRSKGEVEFAADNGLYNIAVTGNPSATKGSQALYDPTDGLSPTWSGNGIYNGLCLVNQKAVVLDAAAVSATNDEYPIDQHKTTLAGVTGTHQYLSTSQPTGINGRSFKFAATSSASGQIGSRQIIENYLQRAGLSHTESRWVKSNSTDARLILDDGVTVTAGAAHSGGGAWELITVTATIGVSPSKLECHAVIASAALANVSITSTDYIEFAGARLDLGSHRLSGDREYDSELRKCQRYYEKSYNVSVAASASSVFGASIGIASSTAQCQGVEFKVVKNATPTIVIYATDGTAAKATPAAGGANIGTSVTSDVVGETGFMRIVDSGSGFTKGDGYRYQWTASAEL